MWPYHGAKTKIAHLYPPPKYGKIIEPFAGSARYALKYFDRDILLVDKYEVVIKIWQWLQICSPKDILSLPRLKQGDNVENFKFDCDEAKWFVGYLIGFMTATPRKTGTIRLTQRPNHFNGHINRIAKELHKIRHWKIELLDYNQIENQIATWFVDPPYVNNGHHYRHSNKDIDFNKLAEWCKSRLGQTIVCEVSGATWLDFKMMDKHKTRTGWQNEVIWSNQKTAFDNFQQSLF